MTDLNKAIELMPEDYEALFCRGWLYAIQGDLDKALADYDQAIKLDPAFAEAHFNRALALCGEKQHGQGPGRLPRSDPRLDPRTPGGYKDWGRAEDKEKRAKAVDRLEDAFLKGKPRRRPIRNRAPADLAQGTRTSSRQGHRRVRSGVGVVSPLHRSLLQPRPGVPQEGESGQGHRRLHPGDPPRSEVSFPPTPTAATSTTSWENSTGPWPTSTRSSNWTPTTPTPETSREVNRENAQSR